MNIQKQRNWLLAAGLLMVGSLVLPTRAADETATAKAEPATTEDVTPVDLFDAIDQGLVDVKFVARSSAKGRLVMTNNTKEPVSVLVPEAFAGVPVLRQFGGGGGGGQGGGGGGVGRGGEQNLRGLGRGLVRRYGGLGGGAFNIPPEKIRRLDVPLLCLDHGLKDPSSSKPYEIRPIEDVVDNAALIEIVKAYANGDLPAGASQAAAWHLNSRVSWSELASKLTGTTRSFVRNSYFGHDEIQAAMTIVNRAETMTAGERVVPRNWKSPSQKQQEADQASTEADVEEDYDSKKGKVIDTEAELAEEQDS